MTEPTATAPTPGLLTRLIGVVTSPTAMFGHIVREPKVLGAMAFVTLMAVLIAAGFMYSERGREAFFTMMYEQAQQSGSAQNTQGIEQFEKMATDRPFLLVLFTAGGNLFIVPIMLVVLGGVLYVVFNVAMGGTATFKQMMAVVSHASILMTVQQIVTTPINLARGTMRSATNLAALVPAAEEGSFVHRLFEGIDLFWIWGTIVLGLGLGVLYRRNGRNVSVGLLVVYALIVVGLAYFRSR